MRNRSPRPLRLGMVFGVTASMALSAVAWAAETTLTAELVGVTEGDSPARPGRQR